MRPHPPPWHWPSTFWMAPHVKSNHWRKYHIFSDFVTSQLQPDPLYFSTQTSNTIWPSKIYQQKTGVVSSGVCSSMCSLDPGNCQLCVFDSTTGICYLGQVGASTAGVSVNTALSSTVYTRMCKTIYVANSFCITGRNIYFRLPSFILRLK